MIFDGKVFLLKATLKIAKKGTTMDLKCKKLNCVSNDKYSCMRDGICVKENCECGSFEEAKHLDEGQRQDASKNMLETAIDYHAYRHKKDVNIECGAESCLFNNNCRCKANGITVCNCNTCALCSTYIKKWNDVLVWHMFFNR